MAELIYLASYPKSGNTWFRSILTELSHAQLLDLRPVFARTFAQLTTQEGPVFVKTHDALATTARGEPTVPADVTRITLYFVRNPLDVAVSYAHHCGTDTAHMATLLRDPEAGFAPSSTELGEQTPQPLGSWSGHYRSWTTDPPIDVHVTRYEDMLADPVSSVASALDAAALDYSREQVEVAVELTSFARLRAKERRDGFRGMRPDSWFFRNGQVGTWRNELTHDEAIQLVEAHREVMLELGYLGHDGVLQV